jgi:hypothetical protein
VFLLQLDPLNRGLRSVTGSRAITLALSPVT